MIEDAAQFPNEHAILADLCIVGAGAAGIALALELARSGLQILVIESGGLAAERRTQALYAGTVANPRFTARRIATGSGASGARLRSGAAGACPSTPSISNPGPTWITVAGPSAPRRWLPITRKANRLCEAGEFSYTVEAAFRRAMPPMIKGFVSENFSTNTLERFSRPTDFGARYAQQLRAAPNIRVILHANLTRLQATAEGTSIAGAESARWRARH